MNKGYQIVVLALFFSIIFNFSNRTLASDFQYPYYLLKSHNPNSECWIGIDKDKDYPSTVDPRDYLVGPPPSIENSAVSLREDSWVELLFRGIIVDGPGDDLFISEMDPVGEKALVFLTDGANQEYLLALAEVPNTNETGPTINGFDIAGIELPFEPCAIRVVGIDLRGGSPGFDLSFVKARISQGDCEFARFPYPPDNATNVSIDTVINWTSGCTAGKHSVFFGTNISDVYPDANAINIPTQAQDSNSFKPETLELAQTYYWRVNEVNETDVNNPSIGPVWSFTTQTSLVLEDFELYNLTSSENNINDSWIVGTNGRVMLSTSTSPNPVYICRQAMSVEYAYDDWHKTVVSHYFNSSQNWESIGAKILELAFHGEVDNDTDCIMYVTLSDGIVDINIPYEGDINDIANEDNWHFWKIDLQSLEYNSQSDTLENYDTNQIDLNNIESISISFDIDINKTDLSGYGTVYFDNIKLYPSICLVENKPDADLNGDCIVDFKDFSELAYNWLESGYNIYQVQDPNKDPIFWYEFEDDVTDSIGNAHGELWGLPSFSTGVIGQAISFDGGRDYVKVYPVSHIFSQIEKGITIAFWQKGNESPYLRDTLLCSEYDYNSFDPAISINLGCWENNGIYNWDCGSSLPLNKRLTGTHRYKEEWSNHWNHWAFTKDIITGRMQVFLNGVLINSRDDSDKYISLIDSFTIGSGWYGGYDGLMDDLRIYDFALSQPEIAYIATNGTGIFDLPLLTSADLYPDNIIDYKDLLILAENWLENKL